MTRGNWIENGQTTHVTSQAELDRMALDAIARILDGNEWDSDTPETIAECVRASGRTVEDVDES